MFLKILGHTCKQKPLSLLGIWRNKAGSELLAVCTQATESFSLNQCRRQLIYILIRDRLYKLKKKKKREREGALSASSFEFYFVLGSLKS